MFVAGATLFWKAQFTTLLSYVQSSLELRGNTFSQFVAEVAVESADWLDNCDITDHGAVFQLKRSYWDFKEHEAPYDRISNQCFKQEKKITKARKEEPS